MSNPYLPPEKNQSSYSSDDTDDYILADRGSRLGAVVLDGLAMIASAIPGIGLMICGGSSEATIVGGSLFLLLGVVGFAIFQMVLIANDGQTVGKKALGIKIVLLDGSPCGFLHGVVLRNWVIGFISSLAGIVYMSWLVVLIDALMIFGEERRCGHDHIASTRVIVATSAGGSSPY